MVCEKCEKKLATLVTPEVWKEGGRETKFGGRKASNTTLSKQSVRSGNPYANKCKLCNSKINGVGHYCHGCAYKKGICSMCGRKILDTSMYKQTTT